MDHIDRKILHALEKDARMSFADLAELVGLSKTPCWTRVKTLETEGYITGYRALLDAKRLGFSLEAFIHVSVDLTLADQFEAAAQRQPLILRCHATTGDADYTLHIAAADMPGLDRLLRDVICRLPGIRKFVTSMITREVKTQPRISLAADSL
ncbi:Lrp/AsnC family leucine-responsive transcriptional regulator [Rhizobium sp. SG_E_25_P2]|jgi:Lrp/AsnC family transcriptional regulator, leucine-responsive regulatory protein|uniref:Lrp/AsnC family transcriptional regulator n=1 Tax=Rhizobium sp. SG_E_25_P2 TaxID=2879942 RepID=UPI002474A9F5|nr:Lrp/AsnC family transcriptional regulator [Rhizobium sp. SG_E_25_P2]MDH6265931.1 Lrp/AsnC family leucine-responsive transcriptional regulator [Rhizobium sp. SG_E_25_P2]